MAIYPVKDVLNEVDKHVYTCKGECAVESIAGQGVHVTCTTWTRKNRRNVCFSARMLGSGVWLYRP